MMALLSFFLKCKKFNPSFWIFYKHNCIFLEGTGAISTPWKNQLLEILLKKNLYSHFTFQNHLMKEICKNK